MLSGALIAYYQPRNRVLPCTGEEIRINFIVACRLVQTNIGILAARLDLHIRGLIGYVQRETRFTDGQRPPTTDLVISRDKKKSCTQRVEFISSHRLLSLFAVLDPYK